MVEQPTASGEAAEAEALPEKKDKRSKRSALSRSVETMYRVTYQNHIAMSQLADQKAGMLISINGLIISVLIAVLTPRFSTWSWTLGPALLLLGGCAVSLAFAVIGSRPRLRRTPVTVDQVRDSEGNVLFFSQFMSLPLADFQQALRILSKNRKLLHDSMARQLYEMGASLAKKYRYLQLAYSAFLAGIVVATLAFVWVLLTLPA